MDKFQPKDEGYLREVSDPVFPSDHYHGQWRQKARYMLISSAYLIADDVESCSRLMAIGRRGVGVGILDSMACRKRGVLIFDMPREGSRRAHSDVHDGGY
ncbi:hypothetical protein RRF57_002321 [Xylaria bambusicola]|uniref:Uncharacterized protein n=1 Tax=Xylaria bambusicola TaxID=326684 RepID=A0AAN7UK44_9PEZI